MKHTHSFRKKPIIWTTAILAPVVACLVWLFLPHTTAHAANERIITIYRDGQEQIVASDAETVGQVLERANITVNEHDLVEPGKDTKLVAANYSVNIYRARPVTIIDGTQRYRIMTPYQSARKIAESAGLKIVDEDQLQLDRINDFVAERGMGLKLTIDRATPLTLILYGKKIDAHTQADTVAELLKEKSIELGPNDGLSAPQETSISAGMTLAVYRNGVQVITEEQDVDFSTEQIKDADQEVGYRQIKEPGAKGRKVVTFEVELRDGKEVRRKEIQSVTTQQPKKQVEVVGVKKKISEGFDQALARLRSCEGGYTSVNPAGPYYGAYQFNQNTWNAYAPAAYKGTTPTSAPPEVQDQAATNLYKARGWQPWPACWRKLGLEDIYR